MITDDQPAESRARRALAALELAAIRHRRDVRRRLRVGDEELSALLYLAHHGGVAQRRLSEVTALSRSGAGSMIQRLEESGYVVRRTDPTDRRLRLVELSPAGRDRVEQAYGDLHAAVRQALEGAGAERIEAFAGLLEAVAQAAAAIGASEEDTASARAANGDPIWSRWG